VTIQDVIDRALQDPIYAAELAAKAGKASRASGEEDLRGDAWTALLQEFADSPEDLARMTGALDQEFATTGTTTTTITTTTSLPCSITTTTTTTTTLTTTIAVKAE
jgi:hypothetical protein